MTCWFISSSLLMSERTICLASLFTVGMSKSKSTLMFSGVPPMFMMQSTRTLLLEKLLPIFRSASGTPFTW